MLEMFRDPQFWVSLLQIIGIDIILSGDNAIVIALACRSLSPKQQKLGVALGAGAAILLRVIFAVFIVYLLAIPYLKLVGSVLLFWIAIKLLLPEKTGRQNSITARSNLVGAVQTIVVADAVMSLDNVIGIAAAAKGSLLLLVLGLLISIPLIVYGATLILRLIHRYPVIIVLGGALLGYIAGDVGVTDPVIADWVAQHAPALHSVAPIAGTIFVVVAGKMLAKRMTGRRPAAGLAPEE